jgi:hypothetical protein
MSCEYVFLLNRSRTHDQAVEEAIDSSHVDSGMPVLVYFLAERREAVIFEGTEQEADI